MFTRDYNPLYRPVFYAPVFSASARMRNPDWDKLAEYLTVGHILRLQERAALDVQERWYRRFMQSNDI